MPDYRIDETVLNVARNAMLLDSNVLFAAFYPQEDSGRRDYARFILEEYDRPLLVPSVVVVESWGMLVGSRGSFPAGLELLAWLNSPGRAIIVPPPRAAVQGTEQLIRALHVDCVDAMLAELATHITDRCDLRPALPIATFDTRDFTRLAQAPGLRLSVFDMRSGDVWEFT